jgi:hypothetical protein
LQGLDLGGIGLVLEGKLPPLATDSVSSSSSVISEPALTPFGPFTRPCRGSCLEARVDVALEDRQLVVAVAGEAFDLFALDLQRAFVLSPRRGG